MSDLRLFVADDHTLVRQGIRKILEAQPGWTVVGEAGDGRDAVRLIVELLPDIAILDIGMPLLNGVDAVQQLVRRAPTVRSLVVSMHADEVYVTRAVKATAPSDQTN